MPITNNSKQKVTTLLRQATECKVSEHVACAQSAPDMYAAEVKRLVESGAELTSATRGTACAICWAYGEASTAQWMRTEAPKAVMSLPEVVKMLKILDGPRRVRQALKKIETVTRPAKKARLRKAADELIKENFSLESSAWHSATGALAKIFKKEMVGQTHKGRIGILGYGDAFIRILEGVR